MNPQGEGAQFPVRRGPVEQTELVGEVESERKPLVRRNLQERERERDSRASPDSVVRHCVRAYRPRRQLSKVEAQYLFFVCDGGPPLITLLLHGSGGARIFVSLDEVTDASLTHRKRERESARLFSQLRQRSSGPLADSLREKERPREREREHMCVWGPNLGLEALLQEMVVTCRGGHSAVDADESFLEMAELLLCESTDRSQSDRRRGGKARVGTARVPAHVGFPVQRIEVNRSGQNRAAGQHIVSKRTEHATRADATRRPGHPLSSGSTVHLHVAHGYVRVVLARCTVKARRAAGRLATERAEGRAEVVESLLVLACPMHPLCGDLASFHMREPCP